MFALLREEIRPRNVHGRKTRPEVNRVRDPTLSFCSASPHSSQTRNARTGSTRVARQAGKKQAINATIVMTTNATPNASGSRGLTL